MKGLSGRCGVYLLAVLCLLPCGLAAETTAVPAFSDLTEPAGLDFVHFNGMSGELYYVEVVGGGVGLLDYDRDGDLDLYLVQGTMLGLDKSIDDASFSPRYPVPLTDRLYRNDSAVAEGGSPVVRFVDVTDASGIRAEGYGLGVSAGDIDNDGWMDLYVTNFGANQMLRNNGDGTFSDVTESAGTGDRLWSTSAAFADLDRDGWLDLYVGNYADFRVAHHKPCATETGAREYCGPLAYNPEPDRLYRNRGDGTFEDVTREALRDFQFGASLGVTTADFDGDGWLDVYVANDQMPNQLWLNQRDGTHVDSALIGGCAVNGVGRPEASMGVVAGDIDRNGTEDLFMVHLTRETNTVYLNDGSALFRDVTKGSGLGRSSFEYTGFGTALFDYDADGWLDLFVVNGAVRRMEEQLRRGEPHPLRQRNQLFHNLGAGRFEEIGPEGQPFLADSAVSRGLATGDLDGDGDIDMVVTNNAGPARLLSNNTDGSASWIGLDLRRGDGARPALGSKVVVRPAGGQALHGRVHTDGSYASSNDARVILGLGDAEGGVTARVEWLDGGVSEWRQLPKDRYLVLERDSGVSP